MTVTAYDVISPVDESVVESVPEGVFQVVPGAGPDATAAFTETKNVFISTEE